MRNLFFILLLFVLTSYETDSAYHTIKSETSSLLNLKWNKAYADDSIEKSIIGLKWGLSYLGAVLPKNLNGISVSENVITIDIDQLGFSSNAIEKLNLLHYKMIASEEYKVNGAIDLGRYISLLLGASQHYYEIVATPDRLDVLLQHYTLQNQKGYINNSSVSHQHRRIQFSDQQGFSQLIIAEEIHPVTKEIYEYETIELLPNGQLRFGIFDKNGNRKNNADKSHSDAGKPAKCMWCHESNIQQLFQQQSDFTDYYNYSELQKRLMDYRQSNIDLKMTLTDGVAFSQTQQHTLTELLYISFMEPSAQRLSLEWGIPIGEVQKKLSGIPTHVYPEFPFLGNLYNRNTVEIFAPFKGLKVSGSVRELSETEVNHLSE